MLKNRINLAKNHSVMLGQVDVQSETRGIPLENVYKIEDCHGLVIQTGKKKFFAMFTQKVCGW